MSGYITCTGSGQVKENKGVKRYNDLNGYFRSLFGHRVHKITVDAGMSCPNRDGTISTGGCIFCNGKGSGTGAFTRGKSIHTQLSEGKLRVAKRFKAKKFIAYFQAFSNTYAPISKLRQVYEEALLTPDITGLAIGTRPDCINAEILDLLEGYAKSHHIWIEYGLQSIHAKTLSKINRGHDLECFCKAIEATRSRGIKICVHLILGLPGENSRQMLQTAEMVADLDIDGIKLHLLYVVRHTPMETIYARGDYLCLDKMEYVELVCDVLERMPPRIVIQRLTSEPHPDELIAPLWSLDKAKTLKKIQSTLESRNSWQGKSRPEHRDVNPFGSAIVHP